jgi:site-specific recombinase XerD
LRKTGNLKLVLRALNHADLKTTTRYAHVLDSEIAAAIEAVAQEQKVLSDQKALKKSPTRHHNSGLALSP